MARMQRLPGKFLSLFRIWGTLDQADCSARAIVFTTLAFSGFAPITHVAMTQGREGLEKFPLLNISITCLSYAVGMGIYVYRVPERIWANKFDIWVRI